MPKTNPNLATNPLKSMMEGKPTTSFNVGMGAPVGDINSGLEAATAYAASAIPQTIANVTAYAAAKIGTALAEVVAPPTPADILGAAAPMIGQFIMKPEDILKELLKPAEDYEKDEETKALEETVEKQNELIDEKVGAIKEEVDKVVDFLTVTLPGITSNVMQGLGWMTEQVQYYEKQAMDQIDQFVDKQQADMMEQKEAFINGMAEGIARQKAQETNNEMYQSQKRKLDKIKEEKDKAIIKAKALAGKALLNLMAMLGL